MNVTNPHCSSPSAALALGCVPPRSAAARVQRPAHAGDVPGRTRAAGGELPFGLEIEPEGAATVGYLVNGKERVRLSEVTVAGAHLEIRMPGYENRLVADAKDGRLLGEVVLVKAGGKQQHIPLHAQLGQAYRFFEKAASDPQATCRGAGR